MDAADLLCAYVVREGNGASTASKRCPKEPAFFFLSHESERDCHPERSARHARVAKDLLLRRRRSVLRVEMPAGVLPQTVAPHEHLGGSARLQRPLAVLFELELVAGVQDRDISKDLLLGPREV